jgi:hypothetical protein
MNLQISQQTARILVMAQATTQAKLNATPKATLTITPKAMPKAMPKVRLKAMLKATLTAMPKAALNAKLISMHNTKISIDSPNPNSIKKKLKGKLNRRGKSKYPCISSFHKTQFRHRK